MRLPCSVCSESLKECTENVIGVQKKKDPSYVVVESLATLSPAVGETGKCT